MPHFTALEISEHSLQMKLSKHQLNLREAINNMAYICEYGFLVIRNLLEMLQELRKIDATLHTLEPKSIFVSPLATKLVAVDLFGICYKDKRVLEQYPLFMPYSN